MSQKSAVKGGLIALPRGQGTTAQIREHMRGVVGLASLIPCTRRIA